jgi:NAD(P)-dependent dehydrogenase (short-subunit alcohol dehydrogenase family)
MSNDDKRVLITGANKGVGLATVAAILEHSADTFVFLGSRDRQRGDDARASLVAEHPDWAERIDVTAIDVSSDASVAAAAEAIADKLGREPAPLRGIINNAGVGLANGAMADVLNVNTHGPRRVCRAFLPLIDPEGGRIVNVASASGPNFVSGCSPERQRQLTDPEVTWEQIESLMAECLATEQSGGDFAAAGWGGGSAYGLSKACLIAYTMELARQHPKLVINSCTPGFIETDMTRPFAAASGSSPADMGMKAPEHGTKASVHLLLGDPGGSGWYFGSDAQRSPIDRYRSPGDPPYTGD